MAEIIGFQVIEPQLQLDGAEAPPAARLYFSTGNECTVTLCANDQLTGAWRAYFAGAWRRVPTRAERSAVAAGVLMWMATLQPSQTAHPQ